MLTFSMASFNIGLVQSWKVCWLVTCNHYREQAAAGKAVGRLGRISGRDGVQARSDVMFDFEHTECSTILGIIKQQR